MGLAAGCMQFGRHAHSLLGVIRRGGDFALKNMRVVGCKHWFQVQTYTAAVYARPPRLR